MENNYNLNLNLNLNYYIILLRVIHGWVQHKIKMKINELAAKSMRILNGVNEHFESWLNSVQLYEIDRNAIGKGLFCCCVKKCHSVCQFWWLPCHASNTLDLWAHAHIHKIRCELWCCLSAWPHKRRTIKQKEEGLVVHTQLTHKDSVSLSAASSTRQKESCTKEKNMFVHCD